MLADSLPDRYGNALIDAWLATQERAPESFDAVERLCYIGKRGMGALEFKPARGPRAATDHRVDVEALAELAAEVMAHRGDLAVSLRRPGRRDALREILRVGTSAGGARPKALIALKPDSGEVRSGQLDLPAGFEHWILKFDGIDDSSRELGATRGYGAVELAYAGMASRAGIEMSECRLLEEGGRRHFMTRRFDRTDGGDKLHMQSLAALAHLDYMQPGANSYEQAFQVIRRLGLPAPAAEQQFRRMVFNVVARNQDDHVKNIAFLMDRAGRWSLSPAFDLVYRCRSTADSAASRSPTCAPWRRSPRCRAAGPTRSSPKSSRRSAPGPRSRRMWASRRRGSRRSPRRTGSSCRRPDPFSPSLPSRGGRVRALPRARRGGRASGRRRCR
jgi:serine/threonine-protein kinase HipA